MHGPFIMPSADCRSLKKKTQLTLAMKRAAVLARIGAPRIWDFKTNHPKRLNYMKPKSVGSTYTTVYNL